MNPKSTLELPSGSWHGHFAYSFEPEVRHPTKLTLRLDADGRAHGKGQDGDGRYEVEGTWSREDGTVRWQKRYQRDGGAVVAYMGRWDADAGEFSGRWRVVNSEVHGRFALRPGAGAEGDEARPSARLADRLERWQALCAVDLAVVRFDAEQEMLTELLADPDFVRALGQSVELRSLGGTEPQERALEHGRAALHRAVLPHVYVALDRCVKALGLKAKVRLFCENDGSLNAYVIVTRDRDIHITLTSGLVNALDLDELSYVLGHELGHALLGHHETRVFDESALSGLVQLRRLALSRYQEISADRVGLLCCPEVSTAIRAEFMFQTGVTLRDKIGRADAILRTARAAVARTAKGPRVGAEHLGEEGGLDTHPYGPMRTLAIDWFSRSATFHKLRGESGGELSDAELEAEVQHLVDLMNPTILGEKTTRAEVAEFMALAALSVAEATGGASRKELTAIRRLGKSIGAVLDEVRTRPLEDQQLRVVELAEELSLTLTPQRRHRLVEDLATIAQVDGRVSDEERGAIEGISVLLGIDPSAVEGALGALSEGLD